LLEIPIKTRSEHGLEAQPGGAMLLARDQRCLDEGLHHIAAKTCSATSTTSISSPNCPTNAPAITPHLGGPSPEDTWHITLKVVARLLWQACPVNHHRRRT